MRTTPRNVASGARCNGGTVFLDDDQAARVSANRQARRERGGRDKIETFAGDERGYVSLGPPLLRRRDSPRGARAPGAADDVDSLVTHFAPLLLARTQRNVVVRLPEISTSGMARIDFAFEPDPARSADRERLGLLGRMTLESCLIEVFHHELPKVGIRCSCVYSGRAER